MQKRAAIIGAGISGLTTAYYLNKRGWQVEVFEKRERAGGLLSSHLTEHGLVESAANGFLNSAQLESIAADIACAFIATKKEARARFIVRDQRPRQWPLTVLESLRLVSALARYFLARSSIRPKKFESLREWGGRALGPTVSHFTIETAVQGVYAMPTDEQSATLTLKRFFSAPEPSPRPSGPAPSKPINRGSVAPRGGLSEFIGKLEAVLITRGVSFHYNSSVEGAASGFDATVIATSCLDGAQLLRQLGDPRAQAAERVRMQGLISATVFWPESKKGARGFGCLFPPGDGYKALGVLMNTSIFENRAVVGASSETWIFPFNDLSDEQLLATIQDEREKIGQPSLDPLSFHVTRWPQALPRYDRELEAQLGALLARTAPDQPYLIGNYLGDLGLKNLLARAQVLAEQIDKEFA